MQVCTSLQTDNHASTPSLSLQPDTEKQFLLLLYSHFWFNQKQKWKWMSSKQQQSTQLLQHVCVEPPPSSDATCICCWAPACKQHSARSYWYLILISPAHQALSSKPNGCRCCHRAMGQTTDRWSWCVTVTYTVPWSTYYVGSINNGI